MIARSLHWRLLGGAMAAILLALVLAWLFMTVLFEHHLERRLQAEMTRDGLRLVAGLVMTPGEAPRIERPPVDSRLETPAGGYYWQVTTAAGTLRSRSLWDADLPPASDAASSGVGRGSWEQTAAAKMRIAPAQPRGPSVSPRNRYPKTLANSGSSVKMTAAWLGWRDRVGSAMVDFGDPTAPVSPGADPTVGGYSIVEADSHDAALALLAGHPHTAMGGTVDVYEVTPFAM